ncbi:calcium channel flower [Diachasmimorpha longicaudata]|uniref:calcium channel flower n=1 Tax=Diachasmimorpha longicaudata TaxID=58733 RepID=UPI0030B87526
MNRFPLAIFLGAWNCIGILLGDVSCLISGMWQMVAGFVVIIVEAPCCCMFLDFVQSVSDNVERRPYWNRAAGYCIIALPAIFVCPGVSSILGSGLIFGAGVIYGLMSIGKKGQGPDPAGMGSPSGVVSPPPGTGPTDHHTTLMEDPDIPCCPSAWSNHHLSMGLWVILGAGERGLAWACLITFKN